MEQTADLESVFRAHYARVVSLIGRIVRDPAGAEDIAVDVFLKWDTSIGAEAALRWLLRSAARAAIDELRRRNRRQRYESVLGLFRRDPPTPLDTVLANDEVARVRIVLLALPPRQAEMLLLRADGLSYSELAAVLGSRASSIGTLLARANERFRKEYEKRYGLG